MFFSHWTVKRKEDRTNTRVGIPQSMLAASHWFVILGMKFHISGCSGGEIKASFGQGNRRNAWKLTALHIRKELHGRSTGRASFAWTLMFLPRSNVKLRLHRRKLKKLSAWRCGGMAYFAHTADTRHVCAGGVWYRAMGPRRAQVIQVPGNTSGRQHDRNLQRLWRDMACTRIQFGNQPLYIVLFRFFHIFPLLWCLQCVFEAFWVKIAEHDRMARQRLRGETPTPVLSSAHRTVLSTVLSIAAIAQVLFHGSSAVG